MWEVGLKIGGRWILKIGGRLAQKQAEMKLRTLPHPSECIFLAINHAMPE